MKKQLALALVFLMLVAACSDDAASSTPQGESPPPPPDCAAGFVPTDAGHCIEQVASDDCPAGTRPKIGSTKCEPVGWTTDCPPGMKKDASGWGCVDAKVPACEGATRESVSAGACVPVGNCNAPFPPAGAIVVDDSFTDGQVDATHFKTIAAAVAAAPAGSTIAVESGTYAEEIKIDASLKLVGRCAAQVTITPGSRSLTDPGILVEKQASGVVISGITVSGPHIGGIDLEDGAEATIEEVVVDGAKLWGIIVDGSTASIKRSKVSGTILGPDPQGKDTKGGWGIAAGANKGVSTASIDDVSIVGGTAALFSGSTDAQITAGRLVAIGQAPQAPVRASGAYARTGSITIDHSIFHDLVADAAILSELPRSIIQVRETVIRDVKVANGARGYGAVAYEGGEVALDDVAVIGAESIGLMARDGGSILRATDTVIRGPPKSYAVPDENLIVSSERAGIGVQVVNKAKMTLDGVAILEAWGWASYADSGATFDLKHVLLDKTHPLEPKRTPAFPFAVGLSVAGAVATVEDVSVLHCLLNGVSAGKNGTITGTGLYVRDVVANDPVGTGSGIAAGDGGKIDLEASAIVLAMTSGILATAGANASVRFANGTIHGTRASSQGFGHGALVATDAELTLEKTAVFENDAIGVAVSGGRARLVSAVIAKNPVAVHVQGGSFLVESADDTDLGANEVRVSPDSKFIDNATKLGTGEIPLPSNILP